MLPATLIGGHHFLVTSRYSPDGLGTTLSILGEPINKVSFRRKIDELDILEPVEGTLETGKAHRPAQVYRLKPRYSQHLSLTDRALNAKS